MTGIVIRIERDKGFGFIRDEQGISRFFHAKDLYGSDFDLLQTGECVQFEPSSEESHKGNGQRAKLVSLVKGKA